MPFAELVLLPCGIGRVWFATSCNAWHKGDWQWHENQALLALVNSRVCRPPKGVQLLCGTSSRVCGHSGPAGAKKDLICRPIYT